jgi:hypothetical protein
MSLTEPPSPPEPRSSLLATARRVVAEAGPEGGALLHPELASELAAGLAADIAVAIERRTASAASAGELVDGLIDAVLEASEPWSDGLTLANLAVERLGDFDHWSGLLAPWLTAVERAVAAGQERGFVRSDLDPRETALVLRDALDRTAKVALRFRHDGYREAAAALVRAALAVDGSDARDG